MKRITALGEMQSFAASNRRAGKSIAVVPTMGFLHDGHASLIRAARHKAEIVVTTVFVNPAQFAPHEDFTKYPRDIERDARIASDAGTDILFVPASADIYPQNYHTYIAVEELSGRLEGGVRPTHFRGVTTIVAKLFHLTLPHYAIFGQKDAQQVVIIKKMVADLNFDLEIVVCPTMREPDGLAMSSRNVYLSEAERRQSTVLVRSLREAEAMVRSGERDPKRIRERMQAMIAAEPLASIDYVSIAHPETLVESAGMESGRALLVSLAVRFGATRLIDNCVVAVP